jgi:hypothetical protein
MRKVLLALCVASTTLLAGCAGNQIQDLNSYSRTTLQPADIMPSNDEMSGDKTKVVIFNPIDSDIRLAKNAKLGHSIATSLEKHIAVTGSEIVDRNIAKKLRKEIQLAEMKGGSTYKGPNIADYAITGTVSAANVGSRFTEARRWEDKKGKIHESPAKCTYTAEVSANMRIYKLPALSFSKAITLEDSVSVSEESRNSNCPFSIAAQESLVRQAASDSAEDARIEFQNYFAPKAYVLERRTKEDVSIFKISQGNNLGFTADSDIEIYHLEESTNPLTKKTTTEEYSVSEGTISNQVGKSHAWVVVDDQEKAARIKLGDYVKVSYSKGFGDYIPFKF